jgi:hypothetical protein
MNKEYLIDVIVIFAMAAVLIILNETGWLVEYSAFALIPMLVVYYIGKLVGSKFPKKGKADS